MLLAIGSRLTALDVEALFRRAGFMEAAPDVNIHHALLSMLLAVRGSRTSLNVEAWILCTGGM